MQMYVVMMKTRPEEFRVSSTMTQFFIVMKSFLYLKFLKMSTRIITKQIQVLENLNMKLLKVKQEGKR